MRTRVGYAGGTVPNPKYYSLGDHSEAVEIEYDPNRISYKDLLQVFWESHRPTAAAVPRQYRSAILYHNDEQRRLAMESMRQQEARLGVALYTAIEPYDRFWLAEDYHQKYYLRAEPGLLREFERVYPSTNELIHSTAVARVNGYVGGYGTVQQLREELGALGLSDEGAARLMELVSR